LNWEEETRRDGIEKSAPNYSLFQKNYSTRPSKRPNESSAYSSSSINFHEMKFTIGLPITKTKYLQEALDGINSQTFTDYELIIKNNANTPEKIAEIKSMCSEWIGKANVQYYESKEQLGMTANFNSIVEKARYFTAG
jgi:hypothetical protein